MAATPQSAIEQLPAVSSGESQEPIQTSIQTVTHRGTIHQDKPLLAQTVQTQLARHFSALMAFDRSCLFENTSSTESCSSSSFSIHTIAIICVDQALSVLIIVAPRRTDLVLSTDVFRLETDVFCTPPSDVKSYHRVRATNSVRLLFSIRYTKQRNKYQGKHFYPVYLYVMQISTCLHVPIVGMVVTTSPSLSLYDIVVNRQRQDRP